MRSLSTPQIKPVIFYRSLNHEPQLSDSTLPRPLRRLFELIPDASNRHCDELSDEPASVAYLAIDEYLSTPGTGLRPERF